MKKPFPFFPNCPIIFSQLGKNIFLTGEVESCNLAILHPSSHTPTRMRTRAYYKVSCCLPPRPLGTSPSRRRGGRCFAEVRSGEEVIGDMPKQRFLKHSSFPKVVLSR